MPRLIPSRPLYNLSLYNIQKAETETKMGFILHKLTRINSKD